MGSGTYANEVCEQYYKDVKAAGKEDEQKRNELAKLCKEYRYCTPTDIADFARRCAPTCDLKRTPYLDDYKPLYRPSQPPKSVLFLCDVTGSMQTLMGTKPRYQIAVEKMITMLDAICKPDDTVCVRCFAYSTKNPATKAESMEIIPPQQATDATKAAIRSLASTDRRILDEPLKRSQTNLWASFIECASILKTEPQMQTASKWLVVLTDGEDSEKFRHGELLPKVYEAVTTFNLNTAGIAIGNEGCKQLSDVVGRVPAPYKGIFVTAGDNAEEVQQAFASVQAEIEDTGEGGLAGE